MSLIAIDPGYAARGQGCACAWFTRSETLGAVWFARADGSRACPVAAIVDRVVWERPEARVRGGGAPAATLIALTDAGASLAGMYAGMFGVACVTALSPHSWKGCMPKPVQHAALWDVLTDQERAILGGRDTYAHIDRARRAGASRRWPPGRTFYPRTWAGHNLLDAVALGCVVLGRLAKGKSQ
jgi:hypothetical protein